MSAAAASSSAAAAPLQVVENVTQSSQDLLAALPSNPVIKINDEGKHYYLCAYSGLPVIEAASFPENVLRGKAVRDPTARLRGVFYDYNCAAAWLRLRKPQLDAKLYQFILDWVIARAKETNKDVVGDFFMAPPASWLMANEDSGAPAKTVEEWIAAYRGRRFPGHDVRADEDYAMREAAKKEREEKAKARKAAAAAAAAETDNKLPPFSSKKSKAKGTLATSSSSSVSSIPVKSMEYDGVVKQLKKSGSSSKLIAAPASPIEKQKKKRAPKKDGEKKPGKAMKKEKKLSSSSDSASSSSSASSASAKKEKKPKAEKKEKKSGDEAPAKSRKRAEPAEDVKEPAAKRAAAAPVVGDRLPSSKRVMNLRLGAKASGEVESTNFYSSMLKAFAASASQFKGPEYVGLLTVSKGTMRLESLSSAARIEVKDVVMADCEIEMSKK